MSSRQLQNNPNLLRIFLVLLLIVAVSIPVVNAVEGPVVVFLSSEEETYNRPVEVFVDELKMPTVSFNLKGNIKDAEEMMTDILSKKPSLIFAVGAKAAASAKFYTKKKGRQDVPVVFAMVLNWEKYRLLDGVENVAGIAADVDPGTQLANLQMFAPKAGKIGVIYTKVHSEQIIAKAEMISAMLGMELTAIPIENSNEFRSAYNKMSANIQALWVPSDPEVYTVRNMAWAEDRTARDRIVMMGQSENIARQGALLAVSLDQHSVGIQAASIARNIIQENQSPQSIGVMPPLGTKLILNMKTAGKLGLEISDMAKSMATIIIEEEK